MDCNLSPSNQMSQTLSPAAQAVLAAFWKQPGDRSAIAAALEAAADQVVPENECDSPDQEEWIGQSAWAQCCSSKRIKLLAIAAELRGGSSTSLDTSAPNPVTLTSDTGV